MQTKGVIDNSAMLNHINNFTGLSQCFKVKANNTIEKESPDDGRIIGKGIFLLETQKGKFIYAFFGDKHNAIVVPKKILSWSKLASIAKEILSERYDIVKPDDYNFLWDDSQQPPKRAVPNAELLEKKGHLVMISKDPFLSDKVYHGNGVPRWGRVEITIGNICDSREVETVTLVGEHISYNFPSDSLVIETTTDISWEGSPDRETEFHHEEMSVHAARKYSVVENKEENNRLILSFSKIVEKIIGEDKIVAITIKTGKYLTISAKEARERYNAQPVTGQKTFTFEEGKLVEDDDSEIEGSSYYFIKGNMVGLLTEDPVFGDKIMFPRIVIRNN